MSGVPVSTQSFNHVAMSVPAELLDEGSRREILGFYGEVFGWTEMPTLTRDRERLVLRAHSNEQFVFVHAEASPMRCAEMDHFGLSVRTPAELDALLERARRFQARDARVRLVERQVEDYGVLKLHSFYTGYLLPLLVEVQCYEWAPGVGPQSLPGGSGAD
jgi:hypothetical protein